MPPVRQHARRPRRRGRWRHRGDDVPATGRRPGRCGALLVAGLGRRRRVVLPLVAALGAIAVPAQAASPGAAGAAARRGRRRATTGRCSPARPGPVGGHRRRPGRHRARRRRAPRPAGGPGRWRAGSTGVRRPGETRARRSSPDTSTAPAGPAVFFRLRDVARRRRRAGRRAPTAATVRFTVTRVARYAEDGVPDGRGLRPDAGRRAAADHLRGRLRPGGPQLPRQRGRLRLGSASGRRSRRAPAGGVPVPAPVGRRLGVPGVEVGVAGVRRPGHDVRRPGPDLLVAARAAVGLAGRRPGEGPHHPVAVAGLLDRAPADGPAPGPAGSGAGPWAPPGQEVSGSRSRGTRDRSCGRGIRR